MKILLFTLSLLFISILPSKIFAADPNIFCDTSDTKQNHGCSAGFFCKLLPLNPPKGTCEKPTVEDTFGKIQAPEPLAGLLKNDQTGAGAISQFLSNAVTLFFSLAAIVLIFMIIWGAFDWMTSGGEKEKVAAARSKIINAIIGILLFAVAFAVIRMLGQFTGFSFFEGQNFTVRRNASGQIISVDCRNGRTLYGSFENRDYASECNK